MLFSVTTTRCNIKDSDINMYLHSSPSSSFMEMINGLTFWKHFSSPPTTRALCNTSDIHSFTRAFRHWCQSPLSDTLPIQSSQYFLHWGFHTLSHTNAAGVQSTRTLRPAARGSNHRPSLLACSSELVEGQIWSWGEITTGNYVYCRLETVVPCLNYMLWVCKKDKSQDVKSILLQNVIKLQEGNLQDTT